MDEVQRPLLHTLQLLGVRLVERVPSRQPKRPNGLNQRILILGLHPYRSPGREAEQLRRLCPDGVRLNAPPEVTGQVKTEEALPFHIPQWDAINRVQKVEYVTYCLFFIDWVVNRLPR